MCAICPSSQVSAKPPVRPPPHWCRPTESVLESFVVITLTGLLLEVVDQLCIGIVQAAPETTESMGDKITILAVGLAAIQANCETRLPSGQQAKAFTAAALPLCRQV